MDDKTSTKEENTSASFSEYKIGHTTYIVKTYFNFEGESLESVLNRMIKRECEKTIK